jgi:hypothetical protein
MDVPRVTASEASFRASSAAIGSACIASALGASTLKYLLIIRLPPHAEAPYEKCGLRTESPDSKSRNDSRWEEIYFRQASVTLGSGLAIQHLPGWIPRHACLQDLTPEQFCQARHPDANRDLSKRLRRASLGRRPYAPLRGAGSSL